MTIYLFLNDLTAIDAGGKNLLDHKLASLMFLQSHTRDPCETNNNYSSFKSSLKQLLTWTRGGRLVVTSVPVVTLLDNWILNVTLRSFTEAVK